MAANRPNPAALAYWWSLPSDFVSLDTILGDPNIKPLHFPTKTTRQLFNETESDVEKDRAKIFQRTDRRHAGTDREIVKLAQGSERKNIFREYRMLRHILNKNCHDGVKVSVEWIYDPRASNPNGDDLFVGYQMEKLEMITRNRDQFALNFIRAVQNIHNLVGVAHRDLSWAVVGYKEIGTHKHLKVTHYKYAIPRPDDRAPDSERKKLEYERYVGGAALDEAFINENFSDVLESPVVLIR